MTNFKQSFSYNKLMGPLTITPLTHEQKVRKSFSGQNEPDLSITFLKVRISRSGSHGLSFKINLRENFAKINYLLAK